MKKLIILALVFVSCEKEPTDCNCGYITADNVEDYSVTIQNVCTNNYKTFTLNPEDWMNAHVGERYCITNEPAW